MAACADVLRGSGLALSTFTEPEVAGPLEFRLVIDKGKENGNYYLGCRV